MNNLQPYPSDIQVKLDGLHQRSPTAGEMFLLAQIIADRLPMTLQAVDNASLHLLQYRASVDEALFGLTNFMTITQEQMKQIVRTIEQLWRWRHAVATGNRSVVYSGQEESVVDDASSLLRYVDVGDVCALTSEILRANEMRELLSAVVACHMPAQ